MGKRRETKREESRWGCQKGEEESQTNSREGDCSQPRGMFGVPPAKRKHYFMHIVGKAGRVEGAYWEDASKGGSMTETKRLRRRELL